MPYRLPVVVFLAAVGLFGALTLSPAFAQETATEEATLDVLATAELTEPAETTETATPTATATPESFTSYTVQLGDTLGRIASRFGTTASIIAQDNGITNPNLIYFGQQLRIRTTPTPTAAPTTPAPTAAPTQAPSGQTTYVVQAGDSLFRIAVRFNTDTATLLQLNNLPNPNVIYVGQSLIVPGGATGAPAQAAFDPGFDYGIEVFADADSAAAAAGNAAALGVRWVKAAIDWRAYEPAQGQINFVALDTLVSAFEAEELKILFTVASSPEWARTSTNEEGPPDDFATYAAFVGALAGRYAGRVQAYEVWDEPNLRREWNSTVHSIGAASYIELLRAAYGAIKAADPNATVVSAGLAPTGFNDGINAINDRLFLSALYSSGLADVSDAVGAHPGGWANPPDATCCAAPAGVSTHYEDPSFYFLNTLNDYRQIMTQNNDANTPIWATKFGWGTSEDMEPPSSVYVFVTYTSLTEQAIYDPRGFEVGASLGFVGPMFLYNLNGCAQQPTVAEYCYYSLSGPTGAARPAYSAVQALDKSEATATTAPEATVETTPEATPEATEAPTEATEAPTAEMTPPAEGTPEAAPPGEPAATEETVG